jgi:hypothetical protein
MSVLTPFLEAVTKLGVVTVPNLTLDSFGAKLKDEQISVMTLFSHWSEDFVEMEDGFAHISDVVDQVPHSFNGILDLCVCNPGLLVDELKSKRPNCLVRYIPRKASADIWLEYYKALSLLLSNGKWRYTDAMVELTNALLALGKQCERGGFGSGAAR